MISRRNTLMPKAMRLSTKSVRKSDRRGENADLFIITSGNDKMRKVIQFLIAGVFAVIGTIGHAAPVGTIPESGATLSVYGVSAWFEPALTEIFFDESILQFGG